MAGRDVISEKIAKMIDEENKDPIRPRPLPTIWPDAASSGRRRVRQRLSAQGGRSNVAAASCARHRL